MEEAIGTLTRLNVTFPVERRARLYSLCCSSYAVGINVCMQYNKRAISDAEIFFSLLCRPLTW